MEQLIIRRGLEITIHPDAFEAANNGIDEDCNGQDLLSTSLYELGDNQLQVYPNPTSKDIFIVQDKNQVLKLSLFDVSGKLIMEQLSANTTTTIDIANQTAGLFFLKIVDSETGTTLMKKIVKE